MAFSVFSVLFFETVDSVEIRAKGMYSLRRQTAVNPTRMPQL